MPTGGTSRFSSAVRRGAESTFDYRTIGIGEPLPAGVDLFYLGGGQDREQALIAPDLAAKGAALPRGCRSGAALLAVCGGYQLLGRSTVSVRAPSCPGSGLLPLHSSPENDG